MNQRRKKRGFLLNRKKRPKTPPQKPSYYSRKQHNSWFSMHSHPFILSMMCKCSYTVRKEHTNKPIEPAIQPLEQQQQQKRSNVRDCVASRNGEATPSTTPKGSMIKRGKFKRRVTIGSNQTSYVIDEAESPPLADEEDYIVFCFEEDGEFHVVTEENSRSQDCSDHGGYSDGSPRPHNLKVEEERFYFSPRLQSDGITSSTRFKQEGVVEARGRVDEDTECKDMDGIKNRGLDDEQEEDSDNEEDVELHESSTECVNGSVGSTNSSHSEWEETLELVEVDQEIRLSSSSHAQDDHMSNTEGRPEYMKDLILSTKMVDDEESVYLSSESQQDESQDSDEISNNDEQSGRGSAETRDTGRSEIEEEQLEDQEESARHSSVSSKSTEESDRISSSSFEFPALQCQWIGSPDIWPKSETLETISFRKSKSRKVCLRLCRF